MPFLNANRALGRFSRTLLKADTSSSALRDGYAAARQMKYGVKASMVNGIGKRLLEDINANQLSSGIGALLGAGAGGYAGYKAGGDSSAGRGIGGGLGAGLGFLAGGLGGASFQKGTLGRNLAGYTYNGAKYNAYQGVRSAGRAGLGYANDARKYATSKANGAMGRGQMNLFY
jgi:hypothetical protein